MLIQFTAKNFRSIKEEICFQMTKGLGTDLENNYFFPEAKGTSNLGVLRSAAIYGANASGKSNLIQAIAHMRWFVVESAKSLEPDEEIELEPFLFDSEARDAPTEYYVDFVAEGVRYQYGFIISQQRVEEEWLFAYPNGRTQTWFERVYDHEKNQYDYSRDSNLIGPKAVWKEATRDNALLLSTAVMLNSKQLKPIYDWFNYHLRVIGFGGISKGYSASLIVEDKYKKEILEFLAKADLTIEELKGEVEDFNASLLPSTIPEDVQKVMIESFKEAKQISIHSGRKDNTGVIQYLDLEEESDGTKNIFSLSAPIIESLEEGFVVFIDELHNSLHPALVKFLVKLFNDPETNKSNAQLIFTTHETSILNQDVFRRDQIWFCEKLADYSTKIYSLVEFKVRKKVENIERNYLSGKYGAVPYVSTDLD